MPCFADGFRIPAFLHSLANVIAGVRARTAACSRSMNQRFDSHWEGFLRLGRSVRGEGKFHGSRSAQLGSVGTIATNGIPRVIAASIAAGVSASLTMRL